MAVLCEQAKRAKSDCPLHSGHYMCYGINCQAVCDANLRFIYFGIISPGKTNDACLFNCATGLQEWLDSLPDKYYLVGDNAYPLSNNLIVPFSGSMKQRPYNCTYNFNLSQMRIRIEMTFGRLINKWRMINKWRIFRKKLDYALPKTKSIIHVAAHLHNFVIDNDNIKFDANLNTNNLQAFGASALDNGPGNNRGFLPVLPMGEQPEQDSETRRDDIVSELVSREFCRPDHNIARNADEDDASN